MTLREPKFDRLPESLQRWRRLLVRSEDLFICLVLAVLVLLPLTEIVLRTFFGSGITASSTLVQHLTLIVGMLGGAIAAREERLLSLSTLTAFLQDPYKRPALIISKAAAAAVCTFLVEASREFLLAEKSGGNLLAYGVPIWTLLIIIPAGFLLLAIRLVWTSAGDWKGRAITLTLTAAIAWIIGSGLIEPGVWFYPFLLALLAAAVLGAPIFAVLGGVTLLLLWWTGLPIAMIPLKHYSLVTSPTLPSVPLFALAGYFMAAGGASGRLLRVFQALVGRFRGGTAIVTVLLCAFFTSFTGASGVTILALGGLLLPVLIQSQYEERTALGLLTAAGSLGLLFPPCIPLILYAITAGTVASNMGASGAEAAQITMERMFLGGIGPGILLVILMAWWGIRQAPKGNAISSQFSIVKASCAIWEAKWELLLPAVALGTLFSGFATPVETAAVTAFYAFVVETLVYRELSFRIDIPRAMKECGLLIGGVLLILGVAMGFSSYLIFEQIPTRAVEWVTSSIESRWLFLLTLNLFLLLVGCIMDIFSAIVVVVPLIIPLGIAYGIDPVHLGVIFLANLELGYLTPPIGMNLFLSSYRFKKPIPEIIRSIWPIFLVLLAGVLLITYVPAISTTLPRILD